MFWKIFTNKKTNRWIDKLDDLVQNYNNTYHRIIQMKPNKVTWENRTIVFKKMYPQKSIKVFCRLKKGDRVRIALTKDIFEKGFTKNWSEDISEIVNVFQKNGVCWYRLKDKNKNIYPKQKYFYQLNQV